MSAPGLQGDLERTERDCARLVAALVAVRDAKPYCGCSDPGNCPVAAYDRYQIETPLSAVADLLPPADADPDGDLDAGHVVRGSLRGQQGPADYGDDREPAPTARHARHEPETWR